MQLSVTVSAYPNKPAAGLIIPFSRAVSKEKFLILPQIEESPFRNLRHIIDNYPEVIRMERIETQTIRSARNAGSRI